MIELNSAPWVLGGPDNDQDDSQILNEKIGEPRITFVRKVAILLALTLSICLDPNSRRLKKRYS
jgi:hypothetical protein